MCQTKNSALVQRQCLCSADDVLDLPSVELVSAERFKSLIAEGSHLAALLLAAELDEHRPDAALGLSREIAVAKRNVDTALEGVVEGLDAVGGEKQDPLEVFQEAKEN